MSHKLEEDTLGPETGQRRLQIIMHSRVMENWIDSIKFVFKK